VHDKAVQDSTTRNRKHRQFTIWLRTFATMDDVGMRPVLGVGNVPQDSWHTPKSTSWIYDTIRYD